MPEPSQQSSPDNVLYYFAPPPRRQRINLKPRHTRGVAIVLSVLLITSVIPLGGWLTDVGPELPKVLVLLPEGIESNTIAMGMVNKIANNQPLPNDRYARLLEFMHVVGKTVVTGELPAHAANEKDLVDHLIVTNRRMDDHKSIWSCELPNGRLELGSASVNYVPNHHRWRISLREGPDETDDSDKTIYTPARVEIHFLQLPKGITGASVLLNSSAHTWGYGRDIHMPHWQAGGLLRISLWIIAFGGALTALAGLRAETARQARRAAWLGLIWSILLTSAWYWAMKSIEPLDHFLIPPWPTTPTGSNWFPVLILPAIPAILLTIVLGLHAWILGKNSSDCTESPRA